MWQQKERVEQDNIEVLVITFEEEEHALNYQKEVQLGWPVVVDRTKKLYDYYGMAEAGFWDLWGFATWKAYFREILRGNMPRRSLGDIHQRGGDVLIDPEGKVRLHHISKGPADRPAIEGILSIVEQENQSNPLFQAFHNLKN